MRKVEGVCLRGLALAGFAVGLAACSSDTTRFGPIASREAPPPEVTGSIARSAPVPRVESRPLQASQLPPPPTRPASVARSGVAGGGAGMYEPSRDVTGSVRAPAQPSPSYQSQYTWDGGTPVTVARGETIESMALRYRVPREELARANGLSIHAPLQPGQRLVIPRRIASAPPAPPAPAVAAPATRPAAATTAYTHVVAPGETLMGVARRYNRPVREIAAANHLAYDQPLKIGDRLVIPGASGPRPAPQVAAAPAPQPAPAPVASAAPPPAPAASAHVVTPAAEAEGDETASTKAAGAQFRWPVRGRVISGFGPMTNGQQNDGINLSVPEGTAVRAAEDGVVAYAGNELKGYGNLVLVRHANGYVTAYAHASELMVKRGDTVRRGQVIAKSGATGSVTSPQLHFEIRKGSTPVDPMQYLPGA